MAQLFGFTSWQHIYHPPTKLQEGNLSVVSVSLLGGGGGPHVTTTCDAIGQSQIIWEPSTHMGPSQAMSLSPPLNLFKLVHYVVYTSVGKTVHWNAFLAWHARK